LRECISNIVESVKYNIFIKKVNKILDMKPLCCYFIQGYLEVWIKYKKTIFQHFIEAIFFNILLAFSPVSNNMDESSVLDNE